MTLDMPVNGDAAVVRFTEWHSEQPTLTNRFDPLLVDGVGGAGVAGADRRMKSAKFATVGGHFRNRPDRRAEVRAAFVTVQDIAGIFGRGIEDAAGSGVALVLKHFVGYALLDVVRLTGEHQQ